MHGTAKTWAAVAAATCALMAATAAPALEEPEAELERVEAWIRSANREIREFREGGGEPEAVENPARRWSDRLWRYGREHRGTDAASRAAAEGLHLMIHADQVEEAMSLARSLDLDDPAWEQVMPIVAEASRMRSDYEFFIARAESLLAAWTDAAAKTKLRFSLGEALWQDGAPQRAREEFVSVIEAADDDELIAAARGNVHEIDHLSVGQEAPLFSGETRQGDPLALAELRGDPTLLIFWASW